MQPLLGGEGLALDPAHLLYWPPRPGRTRSGWPTRSATSRSARQFDAVWVAPQRESTSAGVLAHAADADDALAKVFALAGPDDVRRVWVGGDRIR